MLLTAYCSLFTGVLGASCGLDPGDPALIDKPRVLAVRAEPPEAAPGSNVELSALVAWPVSFGLASADVRLDWIACGLTGRVTGQGCADPSAIQFLGSTSAEEKFTWTLPLPDAAPAPPPGRQTAIIGLVTTVANVQLKAFKRLAVAATDSPNLNPVLEDVRVGDLSVQSAPPYRPGVEYRVTAILSEASAQSYVELSPSGSAEARTESPYVSWFATAGQFDKDRTFVGPHEVTWTAPDSSPVAGRITFHAVVHDGREGSAWATWTAEAASD